MVLESCYFVYAVVNSVVVQLSGLCPWRIYFHFFNTHIFI